MHQRPSKKKMDLELPEIERQQRMGKEIAFRADAAFAKPEVYEALEERGVKYAIRIAANENLRRDIEELLQRPVGRPSKKPQVEYKGFLYQAESWKTARRVLAKVEHHPGELFPRVGFIVTNLTLPSRAVVRFYNKRGTDEQWIKEGKQAVKMTRLSCHKFRSNEVRLWLTIIAYNLGNLWRRLVLPQRIEKWSLTSLQQRLVKTGGRLVKHARYYWLLLAEGHLTRRLFASMLGRIDGLPLPSGKPMLWHPRKQFLYPPGMESCLKKLGLDADWTVLGDPERDARSRWSSRRKHCTQWDADGCIFSIAGRPKRKFRLEGSMGPSRLAQSNAYCATGV